MRLPRFWLVIQALIVIFVVIGFVIALPAAGPGEGRRRLRPPRHPTDRAGGDLRPLRRRLFDRRR
jgi:hypothetical protein